jgi:hypothetical protein
LSVAGNRNGTSKQSNNIRNPLNTTPICYLSQAISNPFPNMKIKSLSTKEVENIIKSLKSKTLLDMMVYPLKY